MQGTASFALPVRLAIGARVSHVMHDFKRVKGYGKDLTEFGGCDPQIGAITGESPSCFLGGSCLHLFSLI